MKSKKATRQPYADVMMQLEAGGSAQARKTYARHGLDVEMFGVSYATLKAMDKKIAYDTDLARKLWASGNHDARVFACWIVEEESITTKLLDSWAKDVDYRGLGYEFASLTAYSKHAARQSKKWRKMKGDVRCGMGWIIVVEVDQGDTSCQTRVAYDSIKKTLAHYNAKGKTPVDGAAGQRRRHC